MFTFDKYSKGVEKKIKKKMTLGFRDKKSGIKDNALIGNHIIMDSIWKG